MKLVVCWGHFELFMNGRSIWYPNLKLKLSVEEQYRQNKENGYFKDKNNHITSNNEG